MASCSIAVWSSGDELEEVRRSDKSYRQVKSRPVEMSMCFLAARYRSSDFELFIARMLSPIFEWDYLAFRTRALSITLFQGVSLTRLR